MRTPLIFPLTYTHEERVAQARAFNDYLNNHRSDAPKDEAVERQVLRVIDLMSRWIDQHPENDRVYTELMDWKIRGIMQKVPRPARQKLEALMNASWEEIHTPPSWLRGDPAS